MFDVQYREVFQVIWGLFSIVIFENSGFLVERHDDLLDRKYPTD